MSKLLPKFEAPKDWQALRTENGYYYHPDFFSEENGYDGSAEKWFDLLEHYGLETLQIVAADEGFTGLSEADKLRQLEGHNVTKGWVPPYPTGHGTGWSLLVLSETEDVGLYAVYARQVNPDNVVGEAQ